MRKRHWMVVMKGGSIAEDGYAFNGTYPNDIAQPPFAPVNPDTVTKAVTIN